MKISARLMKALREFGREGGKLAASRMTPEQRTARARKAGKAGAAARWGNKPKP
mgnify:CR=1 FL=1